MRYNILCIVICLACSKPSPSSERVKFNFGQNLPEKNFPEQLYEHKDTLTGEAFFCEINDAIIQMTRDENLSEKYLNKSVIRVTFISAFAFVNFLTVSLVNDNGKIYLIEKEAYNHHIMDSTREDTFLHFLEYDVQRKQFKDAAYFMTDDFQLVFQHSKDIDPLVYSDKRELDPSVWDQAVAQLNDAVFALSPTERSTGLDGHNISIETHFPDGFYAVKRWSPKENHKKFRDLAYFILSLGQRSKLEGDLKSAIRENYLK